MAKQRYELPGADFSSPKEPKRQANILIYGDAGHGKSTIAAMYAPEPVAFINLDARADYALSKAVAAGRKIVATKILMPQNILKMNVDQAKQQGQIAVDRIMKNFEFAVRESDKGNVRSIAIDTGTELGELLKITFTGRVDKTKGDYGASKDLINRAFWRIFNLAREGSAHLIMLGRAAAIWEANEPTGEFKFRGPEVVVDAVDWAAQIRLAKRSKRRGMEKEWEMVVTKAGIDVEQLGEVYTSADWEDMGNPFVYAATLNYPGSSPDDWM